METAGDFSRTSLDYRHEPFGGGLRRKPRGAGVVRCRGMPAEREAISKPTKEALAIAKVRGVRLGNPNGAAALRRAGKGGSALRATVAANADSFARDFAPVIADIRAQGHITLRAIAEELTTRGIRTRRGGTWGVGNVRGCWGGCERQPSKSALPQPARGRAHHPHKLQGRPCRRSWPKWRGRCAA